MSRLLKEYKKIQTTLSPNSTHHNNNDDDEFNQIITYLHPISTSDLTHWQAQIKGPQGTPYANHEFQLQIECPPTYPIEPPIIHFQPLSMPHCNVNFQTGAICLDILEKQHWTPAWNLMTTMKAIWILLKDPVPDSPLNVDIANILRVNDQSAYNGLLNYYLSASPSPSTTK
ncbi:hypothetical protein NCAS_0E00780 [Naumovozyma castellii]|uniref:UBC core domain-containing protein n=1 Tax=Naumovozyma castellii TaxID=27288 RepID=G0VF83_NAUCA|nr:hypothetical protein NCAS_0E00780 [Naumovozyma castellii CBS 4309]CCC70148.1 hypothetical protein NCAS_0E00780 [Naumovozyma castellii CBS 4309]